MLLVVLLAISSTAGAIFATSTIGIGNVTINTSSPYILAEYGQEVILAFHFSRLPGDCRGHGIFSVPLLAYGAEVDMSLTVHSPQDPYPLACLTSECDSPIFSAQFDGTTHVIFGDTLGATEFVLLLHTQIPQRDVSSDPAPNIIVQATGPAHLLLRCGTEPENSEKTWETVVIVVLSVIVVVFLVTFGMAFRAITK